MAKKSKGTDEHALVITLSVRQPSNGAGIEAGVEILSLIGKHFPRDATIEFGVGLSMALVDVVSSMAEPDLTERMVSSLARIGSENLVARRRIRAGLS